MFTKSFRKKVASILFLVLSFQTAYPTLSLALGSGPVQPEAQGFEPVGTTDMVDPFTGDFVYNIPLMDVEGYPINISYHGGVTMDQEASWVGLGWNINPGAVNRSVRGLPDDFDGEPVEKDFYIKADKTTKIGLGASVEALGIGDPYISISADLGGYVTMNNYRGVSMDFTTNVGVNAHYGVASAGINIGASVGSQTGGSINYGASCGIGITGAISNDISAGASFNLNAGGNYSPRTGMKEYKSADIRVSMSDRKLGAGASFSAGTFVPIGLYNHTAVLSNKSYSNSYYGQLKFGGEALSVYLHGKAFGSYTETGFRREGGTRKGFGYFNLHKADSNGLDLLDFSREKDGMFNSTMSILPQAALTYDIYSVSGQGTGGAFRPHRNDIGSVYDPYMAGEPQHAYEFKAEGGIGDLFEAGGEYKTSETKISSGSWDEASRPFGGGDTGTYESVYFKEAGELTENNESYLGGIGSKEILTPQDMHGVAIIKPGAENRVTRANHIYKISGASKDTSLLLDSKNLTSYESPGFANYPSNTKTTIPRTDNNSNQLGRKTSQVTEIVQIQKDGRRYVYGLPVLNNVQREAIFAIGEKAADKGRYSVKYIVDGDDHTANGKGIDEYYSSTVTPTYVAAHLLTGVLSSDYIDVTGDGITDDDLGTYTKFNYTRKSKDYRWRSPIDSGKAQYIPGYVTDKRDDKASYLIGSREEWMMHSVETKNYVAEFYVSAREDAKGVATKILSNNSQVYTDSRYLNPAQDADRKSFKLDSIVLYNKHDRFINGANAQSIKTVLFTYDYSLCQNTPNSTSGKLTLRKIQMKYGQSNINLSAGYTFNYSTTNPNYDGASKDRWGYYKPNDTDFNNYEFPFTTQAPVTDDYAKAWSLTEIGLPSGGVIKVDYESDDYAYVEDQLAMSMFNLKGVGNSRDFDGGSELYHSYNQPNLFLYFDRRISSENPNLNFKDNYLNGTDLLYYNVPVQLADGKFEPIKGYAKALSIGVCTDNPSKGYIELESQKFENCDIESSPIVYAALNVGRYNLPQIMYPGSSPESSDFENVLAGLKEGFGDLLDLGTQPLVVYMKKMHRAKEADLKKAFVRLTNPGLKKKGGGQRVKQLRFFDKWDAMTGGHEAIYGKVYDYSIEREDKKGFISSGVASWEPISGGDELPQRKPVYFTAQEGSKSRILPNDPIDLYQELPIGESFFPAPIVGYRKVTSRSIHSSEGRSSQTEDINYFYTAKDFPVQTSYKALVGGNDNDWKLQKIKIEDWATQGFSIILNDMHGKPLNTEHWVLKPDTGSKARELVSYQRNEYLAQGGQLSNSVPVFAYNAISGKMNVSSRTLGLETDITVDSRKKLEETKTYDWSINVNGFYIPPALLIVLPVPYPWPYTSTTCFKSATVTKIVQQYGILSKVTNFNQGAITELRNEVFDAQTGNALVTSVNNEYKDREYSVNYPAHWAYKEMGPSYENLNRNGTFPHPVIIDTFGAYAGRFINYNGGYSYQYSIPSKMPVGRVIVDDDMPKYKLGDQLSLTIPGNSQPLNSWVMGYTSDTNNCYVVLATREPYMSSGSWHVGQSLNAVGYRVIQSGNKNRLGETIQSYTTTDPNNIFPTLKDSLPNLISLTAHRYNHNLNQVYAANVNTDSLNPFVTGKVGTYRPEMEIVNLKKRDYIGGTVRKMGTYASNSYWKAEVDNFCSYCGDVITCSGGYDQSYMCSKLLDTMRWKYLGGDSLMMTVKKVAGDNCNQAFGEFNSAGNPQKDRVAFTDIGNNTQMLIYHNPALTGAFSYQYTYENCCCKGFFEINKSGGPGTNGTFAVLFCPSCSSLSAYDPVIHAIAPDTTRNHYLPSSMAGSCLKSPSRVYKKILLAKVGHYDNTDQENWVKTQQVTKYNWYGAELENKEEGIGYNSAVYGYNQQLPSCVAKNSRHGGVLFDGFEDYAMLQPKPSMRESYMKLLYSPFAFYLNATNNIGSSYQQSTLAGTGAIGFSVSKDAAHTGNYSLKTASNISMPINQTGSGAAKGYTFSIDSGGKYVASIWLKPVSQTTDLISQGYNGSASILMDTLVNGTTGAQQTATLVAKSNIIDGWQQFEVTFNYLPKYKKILLQLGSGYYYDDIRIYPFTSNSKGFVYHPVTRKLMATLDENNYATFYEYDAEGNLIRTKKETDQGIMTVSESRSTHFKTP